MIIRLLLLLFITNCSHQGALPPATPQNSKSEEVQVDIIPTLQLAPAKFSNPSPPKMNNETRYTFIDLATKKPLLEVNPREMMIPASTAKLFTAFYALKSLGIKYRPKTKLFYTGTIDNSTLKGELILRGEGDPILQTSDLKKLIKRVKLLGIQKLEGKLCIDNSFYEERKRVTSRQADHFNYNAAIGPLSINYNLLQIKLLRVGTTLFYNYLPPTDKRDIQFSSHLRGSEDEILFTQEQTLLLASDIKSSTTLTIPHQAPSLLAGELFHLMAQREGITLPLPKICPPKSGKIKISEITGETVEKIVELLMEFSNNQIAENLLLLTAKVQKQNPTTLATAMESMERFYQEIEEIPFSELKLLNGSGLESYSKLSPYALASLLVKAEEESAFDFQSLLPISGMKGTLQKRMTTPSLSMNVWAKTGSMRFVTSLAGYLYTKSGKKVAFAILSNNSKKREEYDSMMQGFKRQRLESDAAAFDIAKKREHEELLEYVYDKF